MNERLRDLRALRTAIDNEIRDLEAREEAERDRIAAIRKRVEAEAYAASLCGSETGYYHHLRVTKTPTCGPCRAAHAEATRRRAAAARRAA